MCEELKIRRDNFGHSLSTMTPARIAEASEAFKILAPIKVGLLDAVRAFAHQHIARNSSVTFHTLFTLYLGEKHDRHPKYLQELRFTLRRMPELQERLVSDISHREIEAIFVHPLREPATLPCAI